MYSLLAMLRREYMNFDIVLAANLVAGDVCRLSDNASNRLSSAPLLDNSNGSSSGFFHQNPEGVFYA
jgi:hypothetical protein